MKRVGIRGAKKPILENSLKELKEILENSEKQVVKIRKSFFSGFVGIPLSDIDSDFEIEFVPPNRVDILGSYILKTVIKGNRNIDLSITIPSVI